MPPTYPQQANGQRPDADVTVIVHRHGHIECLARREAGAWHRRPQHDPFRLQARQQAAAVEHLRTFRMGTVLLCVCLCVFL